MKVPKLISLLCCHIFKKFFFFKNLDSGSFSHISETRNPVLGLVLQKYKFRL